MTGAVILVALVVLVVPELLSGPQRSVPRAAPAAGEAPMRSYTVQLNESPTNPVGLPPVAATQPVESGAPTGAAPPAAKDQPQSAPQGPVSPPQPTTPAEPQPAESQVEPATRTKPPAPQTGSAAQTVHRKPAAATSPKREHLAAASPKREHAAAAAPSEGGWHVQVGSFGSRDHADRLAHQLKSKGFIASVSQSVSRGRTWYRVRVGPERNRTAALAMASKLHAAGVTAVVQQP